MGNQPILVKEGANIYGARLISEDEQKIYEEACKEFPEKSKKYLIAPLQGSNLFKVLLLNQTGMRTPSLSELWGIVEEYPCFAPHGSNIHTSSVVVSVGKYSPIHPPPIEKMFRENRERENQLVRGLVAESKKRGFTVSSGKPLVIQNLKLRGDEGTYCGLNFLFDDETEIFVAPELSYENHGGRFSRQDERGMPIFEEGGDKRLRMWRGEINPITVSRNAPDSGFNSPVLDETKIREMDVELPLGLNSDWFGGPHCYSLTRVILKGSPQKA